MSEYNRTKEEYINLFAEHYCNGDVELAKKQYMVIEFCKEKDAEEKESGKSYSVF